MTYGISMERMRAEPCLSCWSLAQWRVRSLWLRVSSVWQDRKGFVFLFLQQAMEASGRQGCTFPAR